MNSRSLCMLLLAFVALGYGQDHAATYYTEPFSATNPLRNTIESQWEGIKPPGLAIYGWNVTANGATFINVSQADIVTSHGRHYNRTHNILYHANGGAATLKGFHLEVADPCVFKLAEDETFRVHYHAETNGNDGRWGQYLRTETVPTLTMLDYGLASLIMPVCRKVYTPDLVCEMISARFVHLSLPFFQPGQTEDFDIIIDAPLTLINETLRSVVVTSGSECPTVSVNGVSHQPIDLRHVGTPYYEFTVRAHAADVWIMLVPRSYVHYDILEHEPYIFSVRSQRVTPSGDPYIPVAQHLSGGAIFGIIIAVIAGVGIIGFALYYFRARWMPGQTNYSSL